MREKADSELRDLEGMSPLAVAAAHGRVDVAKALLVGRADVKAVDHQGRSALWTLGQKSNLRPNDTVLSTCFVMVQSISMSPQF